MAKRGWVPCDFPLGTRREVSAISRCVVARLDLGQTDDSGQKLLAPGIQLRLWMGEPGQEGKELLQRFGAPPNEVKAQAAWQEILPRDIPRTAVSLPVRNLAPLEEGQVHELNLHDWFKFDKPGDYRFQLVFEDQNGGLARGMSQTINFSISVP